MSERCNECNGTGRDAEHRAYGVRLVRDCDHICCTIHGDIGWNFVHGDCPVCSPSSSAVTTRTPTP